MAVQKEIWTGELLDQLRADSTFLSVLTDRSNLVDNKVIHMVQVGADPVVLVNNTTYPIASVAINDTDATIALNKLDTQNTPVTRDELYAISYDKIGKTTMQHAEALRVRMLDLAAHALAPTSDSAATPIVAATGAVDASTSRRKITKSDLINMKRRLDLAKVPATNRHAILNPNHIYDLLDVDQAFAQQYSDIREGRVLKMYGFTIHEYQNMPVYDGSNVKKAFGAAAVPATDRYASVFFWAPNTFKAMSNADVFWREANIDPEYRQDTIGMRMYFVALPKKLEAIGAIVSGT